MYKYTLSFLLLLIGFSGQSQDENPFDKWPLPSTDDLEMTEYALDQDAEAVVLIDEGKATLKLIKDDPQIHYEYFQRIKILSKDGYDQADISISWYSNEDYEKVHNLHARTINIVDGQPEITDLKRSDFFEDTPSSNYTRIKFTFPAVKEGSIIEYYYEKISQDMVNPDTWYFQSDIPVRKSSHTINIPKYYDYSNVIYTTQEWSKDEANLEFFKFWIKDAPGTSYVREMGNVPALKEESYVANLADYLQRIEFQLVMFAAPYQEPEEVLETWPVVGDQLLEHTYIGDQFTYSRHYKKLLLAAESVVNSGKPELERLKEIYDFIVENISWNKQYNIFTRKDLNDAFVNRSGNSAAINYSLLLLLRESGIDANPVLISTRSNGNINLKYPIRTQFNHALVLAKVDGEEILMDAVSEIRPFDLISVSSLNKNGFILSNKNKSWMEIKPAKSKTNYKVVASIDDDGNLSGVLEGNFRNYSAISKKADIKEDEEQFLNGVFDETSDYSVDSADFEHKDSRDLDFSETIHFSTSNAPFYDDIIYLNPWLVGQYKESPFKLKKRTYPVDIPYPFEEEYILELEIPNGYKVEEVPPDVKHKLNSQDATFELTTEIKDGIIYLRSYFSVDKIYYRPSEYNKLKGFFDSLVQNHTSQIVLIKIP